jgi:hypothetical protein
LQRRGILKHTLATLGGARDSPVRPRRSRALAKGLQCGFGAVASYPVASMRAPVLLGLLIQISRFRP